MSESDVAAGDPHGDFLDHDPAAEPDEIYDATLEDLLNQVDKEIKGWMPNDGDKIAGKVVDITDGSSEYGEYPLITVETPSGKLVGVHCFHQVLKNEVERKIKRNLLQIGWNIAIAYKGEGAASGGKNAPHMYRVATRPPKE